MSICHFNEFRCGTKKIRIIYKLIFNVVQHQFVNVFLKRMSICLFSNEPCILKASPWTGMTKNVYLCCVFTDWQDNMDKHEWAFRGPIGVGTGIGRSSNSSSTMNFSMYNSFHDVSISERESSSTSCMVIIYLMASKIWKSSSLSLNAGSDLFSSNIFWISLRPFLRNLMWWLIQSIQ